MSFAPAVILIIIAAIGGYILGLIDSRVTASLRKKAEESSDSKTSRAQQAAAEDNNRLGEHTVLKVSIDQSLKWHLDLDKVQVDEPGTMNEEQRQRLVNIVTQIRPWMSGNTDNNKTINAPIETPAAPARQQPPVTTSPPVAQEAASRPAPKIDAMRGLRSLLNNEIKAPPQKGTSIVSMIDEVLQAKLLSSPLLSKSIRLEEGLMGEVVVLVGANRYNSMDEVPDPEIRAIIKSAISDWEKK